MRGADETETLRIRSELEKEMQEALSEVEMTFFEAEYNAIKGAKAEIDAAKEVELLALECESEQWVSKRNKTGLQEPEEPELYWKPDVDRKISMYEHLSRKTRVKWFIPRYEEEVARLTALLNTKVRVSRLVWSFVLISYSL